MGAHSEIATGTMLFTIPLREENLPAVLAELSQRQGFFVLGDPAGEVRERNRWIHFGAEPRELLTTKGRQCMWQRPGEPPDRIDDNPMDHFAIWLRGQRLQRPPQRKRPFLSGWVGWLGHDLAWHIEPHLGSNLIRARAPDDLGMPDIQMGLYHTVWGWDRLEKTLSVFIDEEIAPSSPAEAQRDCEELVRRAEASGGGPGPHRIEGFMAMPNMSRGDHSEAVERIKRYIQDGEITHLHFSMRLHCPFQGDPLGLWWEIARRDPSPWSVILEAGRAHLVGSSSQCLLIIEDDRLTTHPAGASAPRGETPSQDALFANELVVAERQSHAHQREVESAEEDLRRVAVEGSAEISEFATLETLSSAHRLVSTLAAQRQPEADTGDVLRAVLPGSVVTGSPKPRAIEIIDALEPSRRGPFFGAIGWIDRSGDAALALANRTGLLRGNRCDFASGGTITADSDSAEERSLARTRAALVLGGTDAHATGP